MTQTVSLTLYRFVGLRARFWALGQMALARRPLSRVAGIGFWKLCGAGVGHGFSPTLNPDTIAILATWDNAAQARQQTQDAAVFRRYAARAAESYTVFLRPTSARGQWSGVAPFVTGAATDGPLAALTRATIRPSVLRRFWNRVPRLDALIGRDPNVTFKIGIGEIPMLHQVTFSVWPDQDAMNAFARTGPHADAILAVRSEGWFSEELYARFSVLSDRGTWGGIAPLNLKETP
ncbi:spheroidene monooxygenase [Loktanella sp. SALINAS62]|uniref:spheroidene monooxygenase n=1 Tax=Loktanella sp. SALINAS62 TaxID=2706124 RepID=UPI001B8B8E31|nr:spheroidene monooxygenase [Loktanella sp. SALINAS62]MBS1302278.1 spheroidene monooxygenase [Loktanella sp. SALINAS62]